MNGGKITPQTKEELFNYKHSSVRIIHRCFEFLKMRWTILKERPWYPVKTTCRIIYTCALLHNHIRREMTLDPLEVELGDGYVDLELMQNADVIQYIKTSNAWLLGEITWHKTYGINSWLLEIKFK